MRVFARSVLARYRQLLGRDDPVPDDGYGAEYVVEIAREIFAHAGNRYADLPEAEALPVFENLAMRSLRAQQESALAAFGIRFDNWHSEADLHRSGAVTKTLAALKNAGHAYEQGGALWLRSTAFGDDKDRVLARGGEGGGSATYIAGDLAYHEEKFARGFDALVDVFPSDHAGYVARTQAGLAALGRNPTRLHIVVYQPVRLIQQGQEARLGKQAADFVTLSELVDEVGRDAARFFYLLRAPDEPLDFDLDLARRADAENPLFFAQNAHARCCSVLQNAHAAAGIPALDLDAADLTLLSDADEIALVKRLAEFPDEVRTAVNARAPHRIAQYVLDVAAKFHAYHDRGSRDAALRPIHPDTPDQTLARLVLTQAVRLTLANAFALLGVSAPARMPRKEEEDRDEALFGNNDDAFPPA
jgi:arginyl-tRNA synthetase